MNKRWLCLILGLLLYQTCTAQFSISIESGGSIGWWVYNKGFSDTLPQWHQGYDRTHLSFVLPVSIQTQYRFNRLELGIGLGGKILFDDRLISSDHARGNWNKYNIAARGTSIQFIQWQARIGYYLIDRQRYHSLPRIEIGGFRPNVNHPRGEYFAYYYQFSIGMEQQFSLGPSWSFYALPRYSAMLIPTQADAYQDERHGIYSIGLLIGLRKWL